MEKKSQCSAVKQNKIIRIVVTGPESTGKTTICEFLANHYETKFVPEYAREYVENLQRPYHYTDVEKIARKQLELEQEYINQAGSILFYDTFLVVTLVWFEAVYNRVPIWLDSAVKTHLPHHFLLMDTDLPWVPDQVRENGGEKRQQLFERYKETIQNLGCSYTIIRGSEDLRRENAMQAVNRLINQDLYLRD